MTTKQLPAAVAAATAIFATAALTMPAVAQAHPLVPLPLAPACSAYQFSGGTVQINYLDIDGYSTFDTVNASTNVDTTGVTHYPNGGDTSGPVTGYIHGVGIHLEIGRDNYAPLILDGLVNPDGKATGTLPFNDKKQNWASKTQFSCVANPEPEKVGPAPKPVEDNPAPPPGGSSGQGPKQLAADQPAPVTDAIALSFGPPTFTSITATVRNSSALKAACTYDASPSGTHRDFTVPANGATDLTFNGLSLGASYHAVVSCHDASGTRPQEIGHAEADVTF